ncbi:NAD(P)-dependent oxidoreductase [Lysobacter sp. Root559]|uniref:2-hydroxyacid dehydrogenase n=1 Tax=Lysobacter sp. Root559 TaxID=1736559 RepID=UPI0006F52FE5|nr:NAD(P)-dependent oxidoreductase [Lysobacter sp. Root559]
MQIRLPRLTVMTARGRDSFERAQLQAMEAVAALTVHAVPTALSRPAFAELCGGADIVGLTPRAMPDLDRDSIAAVSGLRALAVHATGTEWVDVDYLRTCNIAFASCTDYSAQTVAEHALAMVLTLSRRTHLSDRIARGELAREVSLRGWELAGKRIGMIGYGQIGRRIGALAQAFGMELVWTDPALAPDAAARSLAELLETSHVVMLACSRERNAPPLLGEEQLQRMRPGAYLINPARRALVDSRAVLEAIAARRLAGYAVDDYVFSDAQTRHLEPGRILQSGHSAWYSDEAMARGLQQWVESLVRLAREFRHD